MSKPLELTIYPHPMRSMPTSLRDEKGWDAYYDGLDELRRQVIAHMGKRLTEPELAAEWWRADQRFQNSTEGTETELRSLVELATLHRFATHPHYFEATEPESDTE